MKELTRDILFMIWGFIGAGICWILIGNYSNHFLIGDVIYLDKVGKVISKIFMDIGIGFVLTSYLLLLIRRSIL